MRTLLMLVAAATICAPAWAMHCPADMAKIDAQMQSDPPADPAIRARVEALREEGEKLHKAGDHEASLKALGEAQALLDS
ncbi:hypothetical protein [Pseudomonas sp.]|uniref:hypothetical protein n=1 Tax=Pseudomonas sp. TaxID=306 RepID=UPI0028AA5FC9|nr:hypothetical protein [Pseudomonas sp.]